MSSLLPPGFRLQFLSRIHKVQLSHCCSSIFVLSILANPRSRAFHNNKWICAQAKVPTKSYQYIIGGTLLACCMRLLDTDLRIFTVIVGFRIFRRSYFGICLSTVFETSSPRGSGDDKMGSAGFDEKIMPVYVRGWSVTTGTAHPCVVFVRSRQRRVLSFSCHCAVYVRSF